MTSTGHAIRAQDPGSPTSSTLIAALNCGDTPGKTSQMRPLHPGPLI